MSEEKDVILEHFRYVMPFLNDLSIKEIGVGLTDREKYLLYKPGKDLDMKAWPGMPLKPGSAVAQAMEEKRRVVMRGDERIFGMPYIAVACPISEASGEIIGCAVISEAVELQDTLKNMAANLADHISLLASTTEEISAQSEEIAALCSSLAKESLASQSRVNQTNQVIGLIRDIADQTNLLGLNAAIEAARVGDMGRGFGVVAEEIRKLATSSATSIKEAGTIINAVQADSSQVCKSLSQINEAISQIATAITNVAGTVQQTSSLAERLQSMADSLSIDSK